MPTFAFTSMAAAARQIESDMRARQRRMQTAIRKTARETRNNIITDTVPRAFGELASSVHAVDVRPGQSDVIADAPHAAAVEVGSRPHTPPLEPLIKWVQLRGVQGLSPSGRVRKNRTADGGVKNWRKEAARSVAVSIQSRLGREGAAAWRAWTKAGAAVDSATVAVARAIQHAISVGGTKPFRYMAKGVPIAIENLERFVTEALPEPGA